VGIQLDASEEPDLPGFRPLPVSVAWRTVAAYPARRAGRVGHAAGRGPACGRASAIMRYWPLRPSTSIRAAPGVTATPWWPTGGRARVPVDRRRLASAGD